MDEIVKMGMGIRAVCQPMYKIDDETVDNLKLGQFPDDNEAKVTRTFETAIAVSLIE